MTAEGVVPQAMRTSTGVPMSPRASGLAAPVRTILEVFRVEDLTSPVASVVVPCGMLARSMALLLPYSWHLMRGLRLLREAQECFRWAWALEGRREMAEGQISTWQEQACVQCESRTFYPLVRLMAKGGGGIITSPAGFKCAECGTTADAATMQRDATRKQRLEELRALEAEIDEDRVGTAVPMPTAQGGRRGD